MLRTDFTRENTLVRAVGRGHLVTPWIVVLVAGGGLIPVLFQFVVPAVVGPLAGWWRRTLPAEAQWFLGSAITILAFGLAALIVCLWIWLAEGRGVGFHFRRLAISLPLGVATGPLMTALVMGGLIAAGMASVTAPAAALAGGLPQPAPVAGALALLVVYGVQATAEEIVYRGWMQNALARALGLPVAIGLTTVAFVAVHWKNPGFGPHAAANLVLFSVFLSVLTVRTGSLWAASAWHALWNWSLNNGWGVPLSGLPTDGGSLMAWTLAGPALWTGGVWGPEGGVVGSVVLALGVVALLPWKGLGTERG